jgi:hypothetical protein
MRPPPTSLPNRFDPTQPGLYRPWFHKRVEGTWAHYVDYSVGDFPGYSGYPPNRPCRYGDFNHGVEP